MCVTLLGNAPHADRPPCEAWPQEGATIWMTKENTWRRPEADRRTYGLTWAVVSATRRRIRFGWLDSFTTVQQAKHTSFCTANGAPF